MRRFLEHLARERPVIIGLDELQWAEPTLLDLIEYLVGWTTDAPILLVGLGRPGAHRAAPGLAGHDLAQPPLRGRDGGARGRPRRATRSAVEDHEAAEGNPLFLEQLVALEEEGREEAIPPSIHAILAARLDRLEPGERSVLERAAVIGREFTRNAVSALSGDEPVGRRCWHWFGAT